MTKYKNYVFPILKKASIESHVTIVVFLSESPRGCAIPLRGALSKRLCLSDAGALLHPGDFVRPLLNCQFGTPGPDESFLLVGRYGVFSFVSL